MLVFEWWESLQIPRDQKYNVLLDAVRSTGKVTTAVELQRLLEERMLGREHLVHGHAQLQLNCHALMKSASDTQIVPQQVVNTNTADSTEHSSEVDGHERPPLNKGLSDTTSTEGRDGTVDGELRDIRGGTTKGDLSHFKIKSRKGFAESAISEFKGRTSIDIFEDIDGSNSDLDLDVFNNRNRQTERGNFKTGVVIDQMGEGN